MGSPGRAILDARLEEIRERFEIAFVVANVENAAGGSGITPRVAEQLFSAGVDGMTMGDHLWDKKEVTSLLLHEKRFIRPLNFPEGTIGRGWTTLENAHGSLSIINLIGRTFMSPYDNPFTRVWEALSVAQRQSRCILVDFHAEATSEKIALGRMLDGEVSAIVGTHTHVQTADETVFPHGTAYISDVGFTGAQESIIGREIEPVVDRFRTLTPRRFPVATNDPRILGAVISIDTETGRAKSIRRVNIGNETFKV